MKKILHGYGIEDTVGDYDEPARRPGGRRVTAAPKRSAAPPFVAPAAPVAAPPPEPQGRWNRFLAWLVEWPRP